MIDEFVINFGPVKSATITENHDGTVRVEGDIEVMGKDENSIGNLHVIIPRGVVTENGTKFRAKGLSCARLKGNHPILHGGSSHPQIEGLEPTYSNHAEIAVKGTMK